MPEEIKRILIQRGYSVDEAERFWELYVTVYRDSQTTASPKDPTAQEALAFFSAPESADAHAEILGLPTTKSLYGRVAVQWLIDNGFLTLAQANDDDKLDTGYEDYLGELVRDWVSNYSKQAANRPELSFSEWFANRAPTERVLNQGQWQEVETRYTRFIAEARRKGILTAQSTADDINALTKEFQGILNAVEALGQAGETVSFDEKMGQFFEGFIKERDQRAAEAAAEGKTVAFGPAPALQDVPQALRQQAAKQEQARQEERKQLGGLTQAEMDAGLQAPQKPLTEEMEPLAQAVEKDLAPKASFPEDRQAFPTEESYQQARKLAERLAKAENADPEEIFQGMVQEQMKKRQAQFGGPRYLSEPVEAFRKDAGKELEQFETYLQGALGFAPAGVKPSEFVSTLRSRGQELYADYERFLGQEARDRAAVVNQNVPLGPVQPFSFEDFLRQETQSGRMAQRFTNYQAQDAANRAQREAQDEEERRLRDASRTRKKPIATIFKG